MNRNSVRKKQNKLADTLNESSMDKRVERVKKIANMMMKKGNFSPAMMLMIEKNFKEMSLRIM